MGAFWYNAAVQQHAFFHKGVCHAVVVTQFLRMLAEFFLAVVHIQHAVFCNSACLDHLFHCFYGKAYGRAEGCTAAEDVVIVGEGVDCHKPAHTAACDKGVFSVRQGREAAVHKRLEHLYKPVHCLFALTFYSANLVVVKVKRGILA